MKIELVAENVCVIETRSGHRYYISDADAFGLRVTPAGQMAPSSDKNLQVWRDCGKVRVSLGIHHHIALEVTSEKEKTQ